MITIEDFKKLDIRIGEVVSAEKIEGSEKLIKFIFDIGNGEKRQIVGGLGISFPDPTVLVGREMPLILNLEPRSLMGHESQGMIMAAEKEGKPVPLSPIEKVPTGSLVK